MSAAAEGKVADGRCCSARDRDLPDDAVRVYQALEQDPDVGGEATMRLGAMQLRRRSLADAVRNLERAETLTRDPWRAYVHADDRFWHSKP